MSQRWNSPEPPAHRPITVADWPRIVARALPLIVVVFGGLIVLLILRLVERPLYGLDRPVTPWITQWVCRIALRILGLRVETTGVPLQGRGVVVANHSSWLDIFVLNANKRFYFVSKSEVSRWPGIGWLARATGTVFIDRNPALARAQTRLFQDRLLAGHRLLFFPEGTSTDGLQVIPFKTTLFQAFFAPDLRHQIAVQPVSVVYHAPQGEDRRFYGWWGDTGFAAHLLVTLAARRQGHVEVLYHAPLAVADFANRKALALACESRVRAGHQRLTRDATGPG